MTVEADKYIIELESHSLANVTGNESILIQTSTSVTDDDIDSSTKRITISTLVAYIVQLLQQEVPLNNLQNAVIDLIDEHG